MESESTTAEEIDELVDSLVRSPESARLAAADRALLDFALKLTSFPGQIERKDAESLREAGFDDLAIHDVVCCVSYFAFVNRIADGLGVELD